MRKNDHILKMLIVKISKALGVQCLPFEKQNSSFVYAMCYIPSVHGCMQVETKQHHGVALRMASF